MHTQDHTASFFYVDLGALNLEGRTMDRNPIHLALLEVGGPTTAEFIREKLEMDEASFNRLFVEETKNVWVASIWDGGKSVFYISPMSFCQVTNSNGKVVPVRSIPKR